MIFIVKMRSYIFKKVSEFYVRIPQSTLERIPINFRVVRKNNYSSVSMLHFHMTAAAVNFYKAHPLQSGQDLTTR